MWKLRLTRAAVVTLWSTSLQAQDINTGAPVAGGYVFFDTPPSATVRSVGQTFLAPSASSALTSLGFHVGAHSLMTYRAYVARFDEGTNSIVGPVLFQSALRVGNGNSFDLALQAIAVPELTLTPGQLYLAFLSAADLVSLNPSAVVGRVGVAQLDYAGGALYIVDTPTSLSSLTAAEWRPVADGVLDAAFFATFTSTQQVVPEPATLALVATGLLAAGGLGVGRIPARKRRRIR